MSPPPHDDGLVWVTGASSGIGRALALELARRGREVAVTARRADLLHALAEEGAGRVRAWPGDVTDAAAVMRLAQRIDREQGPVGTAVLNAGTASLAAGLDADAMRALVEVNLMGVANGLVAVLPAMRARARGRIAIMASLAGYRGLPRSAAYCATKAALIALAESLRLDLAGEGIVVQVINPGFVRTPLTDRNDFPMPMLIEAEEAARRIAEGLTSDRFEIAFPSRLATLMHLARMLPYAAYFPLARYATRSRRRA